MAYLQAEPLGAAPGVEVLLNRAFGPARFAKTVERLREGRLPASGLSFVAFDDGRLIGTIRFWHVRIGGATARIGAAGTPALLLGPVAVDAAYQGEGIGAALIGRGLEAASALGHRAVILVGDAPYYRRFGFTPERTQAMTLPGPVDRARFLAFEIAKDALVGASGLVRATGLFDSTREGLRAA